MRNHLKSAGPYQITVDELFSMINARRKLFSLEPVEKRAMASRCTLRFNLDQKRGVDFSHEKVSIEPEDIHKLTVMVNEQFGVNFEDEVAKLCAKSKIQHAIPQVAPTHVPEPEPELVVDNAGIGTRLKRLFGGR